LRIFDLSNSNEPVLVLSAKTRPPAAGATESFEEPKEITLIARTNLEGELKKLFFSQTDSRHLDVTPRMELIDAVDADGDGRGELLFRRTSDGGSAFAIYRVTSDHLWPLFEGRRERQGSGVRSQVSGHEVKIDPDAGHAFENPDNKQGYRCTSICAFCRSAAKAKACIYAAFRARAETVPLPRNICEPLAVRTQGISTCQTVLLWLLCTHLQILT